MNVFYPNSGFLIEGNNLSSASEILWGDIKIDRSSFTSLSDSEIKGIVPENAVSSEVYMSDSEGDLTSLGFKYVGLTEDSQIKITSFSPLSGFGGEEITLIGENFFSIDEVTVDGEKADYQVINKNTIKFKQERYKKSGLIKVKTLSRGVVNSENSPSSALGFSYSLAESDSSLTYYPEITGFSSNSVLPNETLLISGVNFDGVTGIKLDSFSYVPPTEITDTEIKVSVPEGSLAGYVSLSKDNVNIIYDQSKSFLLESIIDVTGVTPNAGTGDSTFLVEGLNLNSGNLLVGEDGLAKIDFGGVETFVSVGSGALSGRVPVEASVGYNKLKIYDSTESFYDSSIFFYNSGNIPSLDSVDVQINITGDTLNIFGDDLRSVSELELTFKGETYGVSSSYFSTNGSNTKLALTVPSFLQSDSYYSSDSGWVTLRAKNEVGYSDYLQSGFYLLGKPFIREVQNSQITKSPNEMILLSGENLRVNDTVNIYDSSQSLKSQTSLFNTGEILFESGAFFLPNLIDYSDFYITVDGRAGSSNSSIPMSVNRNPSISGFSPSSGFAGTEVLISGVLDGVFSVVADSKEVPFSYVDDETLSLNYPENANGSRFFISSSGGFVSSQDEFNLVRGLPTVDVMTNSGELVRNSEIFFSGSNLDIVKEIVFHDKQGEEVSVSKFLNQNNYSLSFNLPFNVSSETDNTIKLIDVFDRENVSDLTYNIPIKITDLIGENSVKSVDCESVNNLVTGTLHGHGFFSVENLYFSGHERNSLHQVSNYEIITDNLINFTSPFDGFELDWSGDETSGYFFLQNSSGSGESESGESGSNFTLASDGGSGESGSGESGSSFNLASNGGSDGSGSGESGSGESGSGESFCGHIVASSSKNYATSENTNKKVIAIEDFSLSGFFPEGGDENSIIDISGNGFLDVTGVLFADTPADFLTLDDSFIKITVPEKGLDEAQDATISLLALGAVVTFGKSFEIIASVSSINFKVLAEPPADSAFSSSSIFTVVETDSAGEWYVTKMTNPDGSVSIVSTELIN